MEGETAVYEFKWNAQEMAKIAADRGAKLRQARLDWILEDMETDIRREAERGNWQLQISNKDQYLMMTDQYVPGLEPPEKYSREDFASYFRQRGYGTMRQYGEAWLTWEPKPEPMDD